MRALTWLPLATGILPIVAIHGTYLVAASQGHVPWCFPYIDSCTSISATGRYGIAFFLFKGTMIPEATLLILYWCLMARWLQLRGDESHTPGWIAALGTISAIFLVVYTVALGAAGDEMRLQRRIGIIVYFAFMFFCQLLTTIRIARVYRESPTYPYLWGIAAFLFGVGLLTVLLDALLIDNYDDYEDAFEWILALVAHFYFIITYFTWRDSGFTMQLAVGSAMKKSEKSDQ